MEVPFFLHDIREEDIELMVAAARGKFLTTGSVVLDFERRFAERLHASYAVGTTNCTSGLELVLRLWGIGCGHEVIVPAISYCASAHAVALTGARPVFVDVDPRTGLLDMDAVEEAVTARTRAVMPVHLYGVMPDMRRLRALADKYGLKILEDAAHAAVSARDGVFPAALGDAAVFSFYALKNITCGEGGAVVTNDARLARLVRLGTRCGVESSAYERESRGAWHYVGYDSVMVSGKCNMSNLMAALLINQLERLDGARAPPETRRPLQGQARPRFPYSVSACASGLRTVPLRYGRAHGQARTIAPSAG